MKLVLNFLWCSSHDKYNDLLMQQQDAVDEATVLHPPQQPREASVWELWVTMNYVLKDMRKHFTPKSQHTNQT